MIALSLLRHSRLMGSVSCFVRSISTSKSSKSSQSSESSKSSSTSRSSPSKSSKSSKSSSKSSKSSSKSSSSSSSGYGGSGLCKNDELYEELSDWYQKGTIFTKFEVWTKPLEIHKETKWGYTASQIIEIQHCDAYLYFRGERQALQLEFSCDGLEYYKVDRPDSDSELNERIIHNVCPNNLSTFLKQLQNNRYDAFEYNCQSFCDDLLDFVKVQKSTDGDGKQFEMQSSTHKPRQRPTITQKSNKMNIYKLYIASFAAVFVFYKLYS